MARNEGLNNMSVSLACRFQGGNQVPSSRVGLGLSVGKEKGCHRWGGSRICIVTDITFM